MVVRELRQRGHRGNKAHHKLELYGDGNVKMVMMVVVVGMMLEKEMMMMMIYIRPCLQWQQHESSPSHNSDRSMCERVCVSHCRMCVCMFT